MKTCDYIVDVSKPPIFPPGHEKINRLWTDVETDESLKQNRKWDEYIAAYGNAIAGADHSSLSPVTNVC